MTSDSTALTEGFHVPRLDDEPIHAMFDYLGYTADARRNDGDAMAHCLKRRQRDTLR